MKITRREFLGFFLLGGLVSLLLRRLRRRDSQQLKAAMFWSRKA